MEGRKHSVIWNYYTNIDKKEKTATCIFCQNALSYKTSITNLKTHVRIKHRIHNIFAVEVNLRDLPQKLRQQSDASPTVKSENGNKSDEDTDSFIDLNDIDEEIVISNSNSRASSPSRQAFRKRSSAALQPASLHQPPSKIPSPNAAPLPNVATRFNVTPAPRVVPHPYINLPQKKAFKVANSYGSSENEFDLFCRSLGIQLKNMPLERALICQEKLQSVMLQERLSQLRGCSVESYNTRTRNVFSTRPQSTHSVQPQNAYRSQPEKASSTQSQNVHSTQPEKAYTHIIVPISSLSVPTQNDDAVNISPEICENSVQSCSNNISN